MPDYCCENCNQVGFCSISSSASNIAKIFVLQLVLFRYDPMNNRSRKLMPNLKINDTVTCEGIIQYQGPNACS